MSPAPPVARVLWTRGERRPARPTSRRLACRDDEPRAAADNPCLSSLEANRTPLETFDRSRAEQGIIATAQAIEALFFPPALREWATPFR